MTLNTYTNKIRVVSAVPSMANGEIIKTMPR